VASLERVAWLAALVLTLAGSLILYERHAGAANCVKADVAAVTVQEAHNAARAVTEAATINSEVITHAQALSVPTLPVPALHCVRVDTAPGAVPQAPAAPSRGDGPAQLPAATGPGAQSAAFDPGPQVVKIGQACDAQVRELQDYILRVALTP